MGKIPNFTDSERLKTPKTDCALKSLQRQRILSAWILGLLTLKIQHANLTKWPCTQASVWQDLKKMTQSSASPQLLEASTFITASKRRKEHGNAEDRFAIAVNTVTLELMRMSMIDL